MARTPSIETEAIAGANASLERVTPTLVWTDKSGAHRFTLEARATIGSAEGVDVLVADPSVSRLHAEVELRADGLVAVRDLGSRNGTFVDRVRIDAAYVPPGGVMRVGRTAITVEVGQRTRVALWAEESFGPLVGRSAAMRELFARLSKVAATDVTVLLVGETGTGKELAARGIHDASKRASGPFVVVDCAALPENLLESELFGHARGAFTGAVAARAGALEIADGGTVFLDEIGELPLPLQPKLLRAIEAREVRRLGESTYKKVDVRFVSATHRDLRSMVNAGAFREDLYFRLAVLPIALPPLRTREGDIAALVDHFLPPESATELRDDLVREAEGRPWLGNVRELRNFVDRAVALGAREAASSSDVVSDSAMPPVDVSVPFKELRERWLDHLEREYVRILLERHHHNIPAAAAAAGLDRTYVYRLVKKHDL
jgi:transcriptional regulator with GAF, ATPase, and Fis domain